MSGKICGQITEPLKNSVPFENHKTERQVYHDCNTITTTKKQRHIQQDIENQIKTTYRKPNQDNISKTKSRQHIENQIKTTYRKPNQDNISKTKSRQHIENQIKTTYRKPKKYRRRVNQEQRIVTRANGHRLCDSES